MLWCYCEPALDLTLSVEVQLEPSEEQVLVSSSGDKTASVWDRRKLAPGVKPLATATVNNTILSAYFSPAGMSLYSSSLDWSGALAAERWLMQISAVLLSQVCLQRAD